METESKLSFEEAMVQLQEIIDKIESGSLSLEESLAKFAEGEKLVKICYESLTKAKGKLSEIQTSLGKLEEI